VCNFHFQKNKNKNKNQKSKIAENKKEYQIQYVTFLCYFIAGYRSLGTAVVLVLDVLSVIEPE
jgi:hypothetical protein